jgi:hypothetical protein
MAQHCISCGKKGARWPKYEPTLCSQKCAAHKFISYAELAPWDGAHCPYCGENADACSGKCHRADDDGGDDNFDLYGI